MCQHSATSYRWKSMVFAERGRATLGNNPWPGGVVPALETASFCIHPYYHHTVTVYE